jgi:hypothetical protein
MKQKLRRKPAHKKRPNPKAGNLAGMVGDFMGTFAVTGALDGCTLEEKLLVAALIPTLVKIVRTLPKDKLDAALEKMYPPAEDVPEA